MADLRHSTDGPSPKSAEGYDESLLPDYNRAFVSDADIEAFASALQAPDQVTSPSSEDLIGTNGLNSPLSRSRLSIDEGRSTRSSLDSARIRDSFLGQEQARSSQPGLFITAQNDWAPVHKRIRPGRRRGDKKKRKPPRRSVDETREGYFYTILKWPLLLIVGGWVIGLGLSYLWTRLYIWTYEHFVAWRGKRAQLRHKLRQTTNYADWVNEAKALDTWAGNEEWKAEDSYAYYDHKTVRRVLEQIKRARRRAELDEKGRVKGNGESMKIRPIEELRTLIEACVKNNFVGVENPRLYSQTYYGTKNLAQEFIDEGKCLCRKITSSTDIRKSRKALACSRQLSSLMLKTKGSSSSACTPTMGGPRFVCLEEPPSPTIIWALSRLF